MRDEGEIVKREKGGKEERKRRTKKRVRGNEEKNTRVNTVTGGFEMIRFAGRKRIRLQDRLDFTCLVTLHILCVVCANYEPCY